jgi:hypothetical protein
MDMRVLRYEVAMVEVMAKKISRKPEKDVNMPPQPMGSVSIRPKNCSISCFFSKEVRTASMVAGYSEKAANISSHLSAPNLLITLLRSWTSAKLMAPLLAMLAGMWGPAKRLMALM